MLNIYIYKDAEGKHRWRATRGGNIVADSGQGYSSKSGAKRAALSLFVRVRSVHVTYE